MTTRTGSQAALRRARQMGHDVAVFQVVTPDEIRFPFEGDATLRDPESGRTVSRHAPSDCGQGTAIV